MKPLGSEFKCSSMEMLSSSMQSFCIAGESYRSNVERFSSHPVPLLLSKSIDVLFSHLFFATLEGGALSAHNIPRTNMGSATIDAL
jgi:hypothetical protein